jgi:AcrR family transcriptional regulator
VKTKLREPEPLSEQQIIGAALQLIRRDGADRLSMRKLAKLLNVTPMAIYYYVPNKEALFGRISDAVLSQVARPAPSGSHWQDELRNYAHAWQLLLEYPGLSGQLAKRPPTAQNEELARYGVSILLAAGFDASTAALAITSYHAFMLGVIGMDARFGQRAARRKGRSATAEQCWNQLDFRELVDFGVESILSGLSERLANTTRARKKRAAAAR